MRFGGTLEVGEDFPPERYRDRIVHHALTGMLEPIIEPTFISDLYACRKGITSRFTPLQSGIVAAKREWMGIQAVFFVAILVMAVSIAAARRSVGDRDQHRRFLSFSLKEH